MWSCPYGWFEGNWEAPTSISKPRLKPPGRPATTWKCTGKTTAALQSYEVTRCEDPWKTGQKPKQVCSCTCDLKSLEHHQKNAWHLLLLLDYSSDTTNLDYHPKSHVIWINISKIHEPMIWPHQLPILFCHTKIHLPIILSCQPPPDRLFPPSTSTTFSPALERVRASSARMRHMLFTSGNLVVNSWNDASNPP